MASPLAKPLLLAAAAAAALTAALRKRQAQTSAEDLWREATSDTAR